MGKDPAMLWYWAEWHSGTCLMSRFLKGCYMDILHAQFNHGHLSLEEIKTCLGSDFGSVWPTIQKKFKQDPNGLFFNERLELEKNKRANFIATRSNGKAGRKSYDQSNDNRMNNHTRNRNKDEIKEVYEEGEGESLWTDVKASFFNDFRWQEQFCRKKEISSVTLKSQMGAFVDDLELREELKDLKELKNHFTNWFNKQKNGSNNSHSKPGPSAARGEARTNY